MRGPVHAWLASLADPRTGQRIADLGCGRGPTLVELAARCPDAVLIGLDLKHWPLREAQRTLGRAAARTALLRADLAQLPFSSSSLDTVVCQDVLENILDVGGFLEEVARVLKPAGRLLLAHHDFDALVFNAADRDLNRRVVHAYAEAVPPYVPKGVADGLMGRRLSGLVRQSPLVLLRVDVNIVIDMEFAEGSPGHRRANEIAATLMAPSTVLKEPFPPRDVERWLADLRARAAAGVFFFSEVVYLVEAVR